MRKTLIIGLALLPAAAFAQETVVLQPTEVDLGPIYEIFWSYFVPLFGVAVAAFSAWGFRKLQQLTGIKIDEKHRATLETALMNGAGLVQAKLKEFAEKKLPMTVDVKNKIIADIANKYVVPGAGQAVAHFGISPAKLEEKLKAKLGLVEEAVPVVPVAPPPAPGP